MGALHTLESLFLHFKTWKSPQGQPSALQRIRQGLCPKPDTSRCQQPRSTFPVFDKRAGAAAAHPEDHRRHSKVIAGGVIPTAASLERKMLTSTAHQSCFSAVPPRRYLHMAWDGSAAFLSTTCYSRDKLKSYPTPGAAFSSASQVELQWNESICTNMENVQEFFVFLFLKTKLLIRVQTKDNSKHYHFNVCGCLKA